MTLLTTLQARTLTTPSVLAASQHSLSFFSPFFFFKFYFAQSPFKHTLQCLHRLRLSQLAAAAPQATCYPFGDEQCCSVSGLRRGK